MNPPLHGAAIARRTRRARAGSIVAIVGLLVAVMAAHICYYAFLCDDAYIMFRYARNFARGQGLVFNVGERVEGYTSLLWVLHLALGYLVGVSGEIFPHVLSLAYTAAALVVWSLFIYRQQPGADRWAVILIVLLMLSLNRTWAVWATSGLETRAFTFFVLLAFYALTRAEQADSQRQRARALAGVSVALALATFARPDAQAFFPLVVGFCVLTRRRSVAELVALLAPFGILVGAHYLWRFAYYGVWLPNTYYAKVGRPWPEMGWRYLTAAILEYGLYLILPFIVLTWRSIKSPLSRRLSVLFVACMSVHAAYYCYWAGGDHFEFRIFDFYVPVIAWMAAEGLVALYARRPATAVAAGAVMLVYSLVIPTSAALNTRHLQTADLTKEVFAHGSEFRVTVDNTPIARWLPGMTRIIDIDRQLVAHLNVHLIGTRQEFHRLSWLAFKENIELARGVAEKGIIPPMTTVGTNVGVLGYYVDLPVVDLFGLTDAVVARSPMPSDLRLMAHERWAPPGYLEQRHAHVQVVSATRAPLPQGQVVHWLGHANRTYSIRIGDGVWLNIVSWDPGWMSAHFRETPTDLIPINAAS